MFFASSVINLQYFTESFLTGTSIGHLRDTYVNVQMLLLWLSVLFLAAMDCGAELKEAAPVMISIVQRLIEPYLCVFLLGHCMCERGFCPCILLPRECGVPFFHRQQISVSSSSQPNGRTHPDATPVGRDIGGLLSAFSSLKVLLDWRGTAVGKTARDPEIPGGCWEWCLGFVSKQIVGITSASIWAPSGLCLSTSPIYSVAISKFQPWYHCPEENPCMMARESWPGPWNSVKYQYVLLHRRGKCFGILSLRRCF